MSVKYGFYEVLSDMGHRPQLYALTSFGELRAFAEGYEFALRKNSLPTEIPPFRQFAEWLSRRRGHSSRSLAWWQLIQEECQEDRQAFLSFGKLIDEFAKRLPQVAGEVSPDAERHIPTGRFRLGYKEDEQLIDLSGSLPHKLRITKYATDEGCYLEYHFEKYSHESYKESVEHAYSDARKDFQVSASDWLPV